MNKNKILLMIAGFVFAATWTASVQAQPETSTCTGGRVELNLGQAMKRFGIDQDDFREYDRNDDERICCKVQGNEASNCKDNMLR